ncbi:phage tail assembly chaperone [Achromobacter spanius]|jgi:hypothetical protein|uniref:Phage tail assembly chaperone n=1 Tax=Achromobacter spanius TaxID=217203 RepID=A0AA42LVC3_9BURK|nr:phage tail assembly chaperone [Achromobacter spanius]MDH0740222.1 phage tail assembly chaperone [Achromobacter spanius]
MAKATVFDLTPPQTFRATAQIPRPGAESANLQLIFKHKDEEQLKEWLGSAKDAKSDAEWLLGIVDGWEGVNIDFSADAVATLVRNYHAPAVTAIVDKYLSELTEARRGN